MRRGLERWSSSKSQTIDAIVGGQQRQDKPADGMAAVVRRNIANAKGAIGITVVFVRADRRFERPCKSFGPGTVLGE